MVRSFVAVLWLHTTKAQQVGTNTKEEHLDLPIQECSLSSNGCTTLKTKVTLDANWRWVHDTEGYTNCYDSGSWNTQICPDPETCSKHCALEGVSEDDFATKYGVSTIDEGVELKYEVGNNVGSRLYLMDDEHTYKQFKLKNKEFALDADMSSLPCGINAAVYFVEMEADGGMASAEGKNAAGAKYGTGYCDAQCPGDVKFVNGKANLDDQGDSTRLCCQELDIWEANGVAAAFTPHPCTTTGPKFCEGDACTFCDSDGCDFNAWREGNKDFYGSGDDFALNTAKPFTIVTQFLTDDGTDDGDLTEIRRFYVQDGKKIDNSEASISTLAHNSLTDDTCAAQKSVFGEPNDFAAKGGMKQMGDAMGRGMTLVLSIWDDHKTEMLWLDSIFPTDSTAPGAERGPCSIDSGKPDELRNKYKNAFAKYSNIRFGDLGSTHPEVPTPTPPPPSPPAPPSPPGPPSPPPSGDCPGGSLSACMAACSVVTGDAYDACVSVCKQDCPATTTPAPAPSPSPGGCPGGSLSACINDCPTNPAIFATCVAHCQEECAPTTTTVAPTPAGMCCWQDCETTSTCLPSDACSNDEDSCLNCSGIWCPSTTIFNMVV